MKRNFKIIGIIFVLAIIIGCGGGGSDGVGTNTGSGTIQDRINDDINNGENGTAPTITKVEMLLNDEVVNPLVGYPYETFYARVTFNDTDFDVITLYADLYFGSETTIRERLIMNVPSTEINPFVHLFSNYPYVVQDSPGLWNIHFYAVDETGNESEEYILQFFVEAW